MINKKLLSFDRGALRYVGANVAFQWLGMLCNVIFVRAIARLVGAAFAGSLTSAQLWQNLVLCLATVPMRFAFTMLASAMSDQASKDVKRTLRSSIYAKLARLGPNYTETAATSEVVMLASANDAASVLAVDTSGSLAAFAAQMNVRASQLGCTATRFTCPHGLYDGGNYSTARDMAKIALACYADPTYRQIADTMSYKLPATNVHPARTVTTTNKLLQPGSGYYRSDAHGMKTGFTTQAGRCFVTFAQQDGHTYGLVILGSNSQNIFREAAELFDWAFTSPELHLAPAEPEAEPEKHGLSAFWHKVFG